MAVDNYPYITFRVLGAFHVILGIIFFLEGAVSTGMTTAVAYLDLNPHDLPPPPDWSFLWITHISPIPFGIMCGTAGVIAVSMTRYRRTYLPSMKVGFLILCTLLAVIAAPVMAFIFVRSAYMAATAGPGPDKQNNTEAWIIGAVFAVLAFIEFILAIISAAVCCCHSPIPDDVGEELEMPPKREKNKPTEENI